MPATEQTWRNQKLMHRIFAISCVILLISTVWMFLADHYREWKVYQRTYRNVDLQQTDWRTLQFEMDRYHHEHGQKMADLLRARAMPIDTELLKEFKDEVNQRRESTDQAAVDFSQLDALTTRQSEQAAEAVDLRTKADKAHAAARLADVAATAAQAAAEQARAAVATAPQRNVARDEATAKEQTAQGNIEKAQAAAAQAQVAETEAVAAATVASATRDEIIASLKSHFAAAKFQEDLALRKRKFTSADVDAAKANLGLDVRDDRSEIRLEDMQKVVVDEKEKREGYNSEYEAANEHRKALEGLLKKMTADVDAAEKAVKDNQADLARLKTATVQRRSTYFTDGFPFLGKKWLELPILDAFNSPLKIETKWDHDNQIDYNFSKVRRFDRCTTCHQAMEATMPGSAVDPAFVNEDSFELILKTPELAALPKPKRGAEGNELPLTLEQVYGIRFAGEYDYVLNRDDAAVSFVQSFSQDAAAAQITVASGAFPLKSDVTIKVSGGSAASPAAPVEVVLKKDGDATAVVDQLNAAVAAIGLTVAEQDGGVVISAKEVGRDYFVSVDVVAEEDAGLFEDSLSSIVSTGIDGSSSLGAQAILAPIDDNVAKVKGSTLREQMYQPAAVSKLDRPAARAGLMVGDVVEKVGDDYVRGPDDAQRLLLTGRQDDDWGQPLRLTIRRGLPHPFTAHPRLDLYVGSLSPHKATEFGCTICHEGQGSATAFKWASHTPDDPGQQQQWTGDHGWFDNHHWIYPMNPQRFLESSCLKCHHDVDGLEPSEKFPEPPAPKVVHGYRIIEKYGCYGCHEINGWDGPNKRVGPDLRIEPGYFAGALELKAQLGDRFQQFESPRQSLLKELEPITQRQSVFIGKKDALNAEKALLSAAETPDQAAIGAIDMQIAELDKELLPLDAQAAPIRAKLAPLNKHWDALTKMRESIDQVAHDPTNDAARRGLKQLIDLDADWTGNEYGKTLTAKSYKISELLADVETPGTLRKPGPSLRYVKQKVTEDFLVDWIREPKHFRPSTRMPQFFGNWDHLTHSVTSKAKKAADLRQSSLQNEELKKLAAHVAEHPEHAEDRLKLHAAIVGDKQASESARELAEDLVGKEEIYEPIEILGMATYLRQRSQAFEFAKPEEGVATPSAERGVIQFEQRGCLACHSHKEFAGAEPYRAQGEIVQGPDLSGVAAKFAHEEGQQWLYTWLKNPSAYHARTKMPQLFLDRLEVKDAEGKVTETTDPAADIVAFLLSDASNSNWQPHDQLTLKNIESWPGALDTLDQVVLGNLEDAFSKRKAAQYLVEGIPQAMLGELKGAEVELVGGKIGMTEKLLYVGSKAIGKYGCYGCHDIPGFEGAKPIGTGLADWGRKDPSKLAFNHIANYLQGHAGGGHSAHQHDEDEDHDQGGDQEEKHDGQPTDGDDAAQAAAENSVAGMFDPNGGDAGFYHHALLAGHRAGFIYQKLAEPRSYDYHQTDNIKYNERLRMPAFGFTDVEREAVITFVLGLVAEPPRPKFLYTPKKREKAIIEGRQVLEKYNCGGCHVLEPQKWEVSLPSGGIDPRVEPESFPFLRADFAPNELAASTVPDRQGNVQAELIGLPTISNGDGRAEVNGDFEGDAIAIDSETGSEPFDPTKLQMNLDLYRPTMVDGSVFQVGVQQVTLKSELIKRRTPSDGGFLATYLVPKVAARNTAKKDKAKEAWAWVPPTLAGEGRKVQTEWLHDFLLDPYPIRPGVVLRMPKFNMSPAEATKLANYFAAVDNAEYPYEFSGRRRTSHLEELEAEYRARVGGGEASSDESSPVQPNAAQPSGAKTVRFDDAMKIVSGKDGCVKCHKVGELQPSGPEADKAPNLADVYRRLRPDYVRRWIARPMQILPYTAMPEMIKYSPLAPHEGGVSQSLYHGTSTEQLDALVDLLMNFDRYSVNRNSVPEKGSGGGS